ncbi:MAG: hypothetical protein DRJ37_04655 [Thermoprotei archaeon]|nr:MAG: hypothetical protein DRJ37_04655 [Thermoprotei archaeon]
MNVDELERRIRNLLEKEALLRERAILRIRFKTKMFRIGAAFTAALSSSLPVLKVNIGAEEFILIPESSWRGSIRKISEWVACASIEAIKDELEKAIVKAHHEHVGGPPTHLAGAEQPIDIAMLVMVAKELSQDGTLERFLAPEEVSDVISKAEKISKGETLTVKQEEKLRKVLEPLVAFLCPICRLWGGFGIKSKIILEDTILKPSTFMRTHVSLSRIADVREEARLYSAEYTLANVIELKAVIENVLPDSTEALILAGTLEWINEIGLEIGGFRSKGLGHLELESCEVILIRFNGLECRELVQALISPEEAGIKMPLHNYIKYLRSQGTSSNPLFLV